MLRRTASALILLLVLAPFGLSGCQSAAARSTPQQDSLRATCADFVKSDAVVGMSVAVIDDGNVIFENSFGFADREAARPAKSSTLYRLGSISKPVCAAIAMQLVDEHVLALERPVGEYVPDLPGAIRPLTLMQLLSHTSGVRHYVDGKEDNGTKHRSTREALQLFVNDALLFTPGAKFSYSTHAYTLVMACIEAATKSDYVSVLRERMQRVAPTLDCEVLSDAKPQRSSLYGRLESGEVALQPEREDNSWKYGGGGLESTALDLAHFGQAMLDGKLVSKESREKMWSPMILSDGSKSRYGLGWGVAADGASVSHSGSQQGCTSMLILVPSEGLVIAVLTNTEGCGAPKLGQTLREQLVKASHSASAK